MNTNDMKNGESAVGDHSLCLDEILDISKASELRDQLVPFLQRNGTVTIDAEHVVRVDTACLQLLSAFMNDAYAKDIAIRWHKPSEAMRRSAELLGLTAVLRFG